MRLSLRTAGRIAWRETRSSLTKFLFVVFAVAIGVGNELIPRKAVEQRQRDWIMELARRFVSLVKAARGVTTAKHEGRVERK